MRTTIVSTTILRKYKTFIFVVDGLIFIGLLTLLFYANSVVGKWNDYVLPILVYLQFHMYYPMFLKLKNVSYDDSFIYYNKNGYEVQIPFEDVLSIEIKSLTGIYGVKLMNPSQGEKEIYFKASVWYPFNFQKKDEIVQELREHIDRYKRTLAEKNFAQLTSYQL